MFLSLCTSYTQEVITCGLFDPDVLDEKDLAIRAAGECVQVGHCTSKGCILSYMNVNGIAWINSVQHGEVFATAHVVK